ncbi:2630_t:CDS:2 [Gigaspora margarita]|uniref:2630_t:CDS:1 n=1 Tax=Gigaspora margarita TaxID=4874 RepID=A0ABM8W3S9_GIGMA|nr:2630_t:CDS:2 [Gigaspora margarita]
MISMSVRLKADFYGVNGRNRWITVMGALIAAIERLRRGMTVFLNIYIIKAPKIMSIRDLTG